MVEKVRVDLQREFRSPEARANPFPVYARLRELGPVLRSKGPMGEGFILPRHTEVARVIRDPRFGSDRGKARGDASMSQWWMPA